MATVSVDLPEEIVARLAAKWEDLPRAALEALLAEAYRDELLTAEQLRRLLGYGTRMQVDEFFKRHGVCTYTIEDFEQDRETLRQLRKESAH